LPPECHPQDMKTLQALVAAASLSLACTMPLLAQETGPWRAASKTAESITGDVALSDSRMAINFATFPIARIRDLDPGETTSVFDADASAGAKAHLYRLNIPADRKFLHKNTLCGTEDTQWMVTFVEGRSLHVALFSGTKMPVFTPEAIANTTDLCGTFMYAR
jgi:hypothetical protein